MGKVSYIQIKQVKDKFDNIDKEVLTNLGLYNDISLNTEQLLTKLNGATVLVTGGSGSIGSELCKQLIELKIRKLIILDIYENSTYMLYQDILLIKKRKSIDCDIKLVIGSVCDEKVLEDLFKSESIDYVFHAAAYKHVPLMEENPRQAILTNCIGTRNVFLFANSFGVKEMILISTDKAINPINVMGASKKIAEMYINNKCSKTIVKTVRFGNVFNSNGSIVPILIKQILNNKKITITHKEATRYFMNIKNAVSLILQILTFKEEKCIYFLDMKKQISIVKLAEEIISFMGLKPYIDVEIEYIGLRKAEKVIEEKINYKTMNKTSHPSIYMMNNSANKSFEEIEDFVKTIMEDFNKEKLLEFTK